MNHNTVEDHVDDDEFEIHVDRPETDLIEETVVKIEFASNDEAELFNDQLDERLAAVREAIGCPYATIVAPIGHKNAAKRGSKPSGVAWHVVQRLTDLT